MKVSELYSIVNPDNLVVASDQDEISELCIDSRKVVHPEQTLFFAIKTEKNDGHRYIPQLQQMGVRNFVVSNPVESLQAIARAHRQYFRYPVVGITGSNGKTIVKEWLATLLADDFNIVRSPDSYNSQLGVPLSVWQMSDSHQLAIFEAGISRPGEMQQLADIIRPTMGILTNIGMAHAQFFSSERQKIVEKLQLFKTCEKLIYHDDNKIVEEILAQPEYAHLQKISWGSASAAYPVEHRHAEGDTTVVELAHECYKIPFLDAASVENALHVIVTALELGCQPADIRERLPRLTRIKMRTEILEGRNHSVIINDTYSLDSNSLNAALDFMDTQTQMDHKTLILSDFEQVGKMSDQDYRELNRRLQQHNITKLLAVGAHLCEHAHCFDCPAQWFFKDTATLLAELQQIPISYETILVKGARSFHFERVVSRLQHKTHLTILHVDLPALVHNLNFHRSFLNPDTKLVAMVKANSYGLGDAEIINDLVHHGVDYLAVAYTDEGVRLRKRHITTPIIVLGAEAHSFDVMVQHSLEPEIFNFYYLDELVNVLQKHPEIRQFNIHLKFDTGMHRLGFDLEDVPRLIRKIQSVPQLHVASVFSHLAAAEDPSEDAYTHHQIDLFQQMTDPIIGAFDYPVLRHILNSAGIIRFTESQFEMVRLGIGLYGCSEIPEVAEKLHNVVTLKTVVTQVKRIAAGETIGYNRSFRLAHDTQVAIIPIGYADGYPRELGNGKGTVVIQGQKVPVIGKICMDMCMLDVTGLNVHEGDEVVVYGEGNTVGDMAKAAGLISYELMTRISQRVPRVYVRE